MEHFDVDHFHTGLFMRLETLETASSWEQTEGRIYSK